MPDTIRDFVMEQKLFDAHEHIITIPEFASSKPNFSSFVGYAEADIVTAIGVVHNGAGELPSLQ